MAPTTIRIWDRPVRLLHWGLVAAVVIAWLSGHSFITIKLHEPLGYAALAIILTRIVWGFAGSPYARFRQFVRRPRIVTGYARDILEKREARYLGHNPLGGWMVLALIACIAALGFTGWLYTTDAFWGEAWLDGLHQALAWILLALVTLHLSGVVFTSFRHRENLVTAMISGDKKPAGDSDVA